MADLNVSQTTTTDMSSRVDDYSVAFESLDSPTDQDENYYNNSKWSEYLGYYKNIPELKKAIDALACWTTGKGWTANNRTQVILDKIIGWGEDSFDSILQNLIIVKKINGDAYAEIVRNEKGTLINLKPLNPNSMMIVTDKKGIIQRYEELDKTRKKTKWRYKPVEIFHISNDRIANEMHGVSVVEACKWVIDARNEAMSDWRRILHRNLAGVRIIEVDEDDPTKLTEIKNMWADAINKGEVMILPKGTASIPNINPPVSPEMWIRYLENFFYQAVGVPKAILGGTADYTESSSKTAIFTFDQVWMTEQRLLEQDIWGQLALRVKFERPTSLKDNMQGDEAANTGQMGFQPKETGINTERE